MKPGIIECAFQGTVGRDPQRRTSQNTGRDWASFSVACGEDENAQWLDVACFGPSVDQAVQLTKGDAVYVEGKISLRTWQNEDGSKRTTLSVAAKLVQPMGRIGNRKPKQTRKTSAAGETQKPKSSVNAPLDFNDPLPF